MRYGIWINTIKRFRTTFGVVQSYERSSTAARMLTAFGYSETSAEVREVRNPDCGGGHCTSDRGEVRIMPLGGDANQILCRACFAHENRYRQQRARETGAPENWPTVDWDTAKRYPTDE